MKVKNKILQAAFIFIAATIIIGCANTQHIKSDQPIDTATVKNMIDSQSFVLYHDT